jgi:hypothetical protein
MAVPGVIRDHLRGLNRLQNRVMELCGNPVTLGYALIKARIHASGNLPYAHLKNNPHTQQSQADA